MSFFIVVVTYQRMVHHNVIIGIVCDIQYGLLELEQSF